MIRSDKAYKWIDLTCRQARAERRLDRRPLRTRRSEGRIRRSVPRDVAPLPRPLLRHQHARLRLAALRAEIRAVRRMGRRCSDLNYVLGQMVAELSIGHAYVSGGDLGLRRSRSWVSSARDSSSTPRRTDTASPTFSPDENDEDRYRRRSPKSASMCTKATTCSRSTARRSSRTTIRIASCARRRASSSSSRSTRIRAVKARARCW